jgi:hypothetical protein
MLVDTGILFIRVNVCESHSCVSMVWEVDLGYPRPSSRLRSALLKASSRLCCLNYNRKSNLYLQKTSAYKQRGLSKTKCFSYGSLGHTCIVQV